MSSDATAITAAATTSRIFTCLILSVHCILNKERADIAFYCLFT